MVGRERVLVALDGGIPDRVPCALGFCHVDLTEILPSGHRWMDFIDVQFVRPAPSPEELVLRETGLPFSYDTRLGSVEQVATYSRWSYHPQTPEQRNPLARASSLDDLKAFAFPEVGMPEPVAELADQVEALHSRGLAAGGNLPHLGGELFEAAWRLRGLENLLLDLVERPTWADYLLDRLTDIACKNAAVVAQAGADVLSLDDDVGAPVTMMISPSMWRRFFKPRMRRIIQVAREIRPELRILFHSDGNFAPIIPDLIDIGVNAINPLQPEHMDAARIRDRFGPRLALWGTVGAQTTFSGAQPTDIRHEVRQRITTLGRAGLILSPAYDLDEPDTAWANVAAFLEAVHTYG